MEKSGPQIGGKIRRLRRQKHVSQADLAAALGISASYLNLLEHNRRNVTVPLLFKLAGHFGIEPGELVESDEGQLTGDLMELFGDDIFADTDLTNQGQFCGYLTSIRKPVPALFQGQWMKSRNPRLRAIIWQRRRFLISFKKTPITFQHLRHQQSGCGMT